MHTEPARRLINRTSASRWATLGRRLSDAETQPLDAAPADREVSERDATLPIDTGRADAMTEDAGQAEDAGPMAGCGHASVQNNRRWTLTHDGRAREFLVHLPDNYDAFVPTPLVFDFHGRVFSATNQIALSKMRDVADDEGFVVVHPEGIGRTWNGGVCCGEASQDDVDDVGFTSAMIDQLTSELCIDDRRVYATGMSNSGFLAHRLGCELSDRITAIAPVAGVMGVANCSPVRSVPVFHFHGTSDMVVRYDGFAGFLSVADSMQAWVNRNGCAAQSSVYFQLDDVTCEAWTGCDGGAEVRLCTVAGGGHTWPGGGPLIGLGDTTNTIEASRLMWTFFSQFQLP